MSSPDSTDAVISQIATWLSESRSAIAFTGAGMSTESGIPDFRSPGGVWATSTPVMFDNFCRNHDARCEYWRQKCLTHHEFVRAEPNVGHRLLAEWEQAGRLRGVITQNIDGLHSEAGNQSVVEMHGTAREVGCLKCGLREPADRWVAAFEASGEPPSCPTCGGWLKHATISFGQQLDPQVLETAAHWANDCDLMIVLGSSLVVEPAASLPVIAVERGARLVIINRVVTPHDQLADLVLHDEIGPTLTEVDRLLPNRQEDPSA